MISFTLAKEEERNACKGVVAHMPRKSSTFSMVTDLMTLGLEASAVASLRLIDLARGKTSSKEAALMVSEKVQALLHAQSSVTAGILSGRTGTAFPTVVGIYTKAARANRKRLTRRR